MSICVTGGPGSANLLRSARRSEIPNARRGEIAMWLKAVIAVSILSRDLQTI